MIGTIVVIVLVVAIVIYGVLDQTVIKAQRPVAKVGSQSITTSAFQKEVRFQRSQNIQQLKPYMSDPFIMQIYGSYITQLGGQLADTTSMGQSVLDSMVEDAVIAQEAKKLGITLTEAEVDKAFQEAFGFYENGTPTPTITGTPYQYAHAFLPPANPRPAHRHPHRDGCPHRGAHRYRHPAHPDRRQLQPPPRLPKPRPPQQPSPPRRPHSPNRDLKTGFATFTANLKPVGYTQADLRGLIRRQLLRQKVVDAVTKDVGTSADRSGLATSWLQMKKMRKKYWTS